MVKTARIHHDTPDSRGKAKPTGAPWIDEEYKRNNWQTEDEYRHAKTYDKRDYKYDPEYQATVVRTALNSSRYINAPSAKHARLASISAHLKHRRKGGRKTRRKSHKRGSTGA
jgi:hypothetical protein